MSRTPHQAFLAVTEVSRLAGYTSTSGDGSRKEKGLGWLLSLPLRHTPFNRQPVLTTQGGVAMLVHRKIGPASQIAGTMMYTLAPIL